MASGSNMNAHFYQGGHNQPGSQTNGVQPEVMYPSPLRVKSAPIENNGREYK